LVGFQMIAIFIVMDGSFCRVHVNHAAGG
jgi:hypothetical protein